MLFGRSPGPCSRSSPSGVTCGAAVPAGASLPDPGFPPSPASALAFRHGHSAPACYAALCTVHSTLCWRVANQLRNAQITEVYAAKCGALKAHHMASVRGLESTERLFHENRKSADVKRQHMMHACMHACMKVHTRAVFIGVAALPGLVAAISGAVRDNRAWSRHVHRLTDLRMCHCGAGLQLVRRVGMCVARCTCSVP